MKLRLYLRRAISLPPRVLVKKVVRQVQRKLGPWVRSAQGAGWVQVRHGIPCSGLEGYRYEMGSSVQVDREGRWLQGRINFANLKESQRIWRLIDTHYIPVDWQLDFKSGYRWSEETWYLKIPSGHKPGVDIKVPWELARMQHLPSW